MEKLTLYRVDQPKKPTTYQIAHNPGLAKSMHISVTYRNITGRRALDAFQKLTVQPATEEEAKAYVREILEANP